LAQRRLHSFDDLLGAFSAEKRKKVKRERRRVVEAGVAFGACGATR
jgi:predicted N-acyltransferase